RVSDVAAVRDTTEDVNSYARLNGEPIVLLEVFKQSDANAVAVAEGVRTTLNNLELPQNAEAIVVLDSTEFIANSVSDTIRETALAVVIVGLIILLFVGRLGSVFSVVIAIPISFSGALIAFALLGFTYNIISLLAVTVAVGLVVDDSIVIAENATRYRDMGYSALESVFKGAGEVSTPVLASTLSLLAVFLPISFLPGILGDLFSEFGLTLAATIATSYLEAMFFLTVRLAYLPDPYLANWQTFGGAFGKFVSDIRRNLRALRRPGMYVLMVIVGLAGFIALRTAFDGPTPLSLGILAVLVLAVPLLVAILTYILRIVTFFVGALLYSAFRGVGYSFERLQVVYSRMLRAVLRAPAIILVVAFLLFLSLGYVAPQIGFSFTADPDSGQAVVSLELPNTSNLGETNSVAFALEERLLVSPLVTSIQTSVGVGGDDISTENPTNAEMLINLVPKDQREDSTAEIAGQLQDMLRAELDVIYPAAVVSAGAFDNFGPPESSAYDVSLSGNNLDIVRERDALARDIVQNHPALINVDSSLSDTVSERVFVLDSAKLVGTGLSAADVYTALRVYNVGITSGNVRTGGEDYDIRIKANPSLLADEQALLSLPVFSQALGRSLPLSEFGRFELREAPTTVYRNSQTYATTVVADISPTSDLTLSQVRAEVRQDLIDAGVVDDQVTFTQASAFDLTGDLILYTPIAFALALLLNYLVIASQFNSFRFPLYLMLTIPLAFVGAFWLLFVTNTSLDVNSALGLVILVGLVTKNAILLLDVVVSGLQGEFTNLKDALVNAGERRLRPIMMTTLTLVAISLPLLFGSGTGSEFRRPLGLIIFGGVTASALLTLFVVPAAFYLFERRRLETPDTSSNIEGQSSEASQRVPSPMPTPLPEATD
ncbi:MAG: efflux RND transporter permease subunit, partial [Deinococcota bacterium]